MDSVCPYLGLMDDPKSSTLYPTHCNACFRSKPPHPIKLDYQRTVCLTEKHLECEGFIKGWKRRLPKKLRNWKCGRKQLDARKFWTIAGILLSIGLLLGLIFVLNNIGPAPIATIEGGITVADVLATETEHAASPTEAPSETQTAQATATNTSTANPTHTPSPAYTATFTPGPALMTPFGDLAGDGEAQFLIYEVSIGDSLQLISNLFNTTPDVLSAINVRESLSLWVGDVIVVCVGCAENPGLPPLEAVYLEEEISIEALAEECECTPSDLRLWNGLDEGEWILADRWIVIPAD